ncbi:hypothetical protein [Iningainema tapete]|uniref:Uncharacterized protein n=1 Tax=Iningainema tapete BLCC-T55 TaxID=2748662 RepID=A0A8J6XDK6_9CYAN|nr:hypothetical protein [Iningainema tapete]MBD2771503.1 hypothetical protein [Iningainema tapete BLCC-T55]
MLEKNNSLLTAVSDEESATVSGGQFTGINTQNNQLIFGEDGSLKLVSNLNGSFTGSDFTSNFTLDISPTSIANLQGSSFANQSPDNVVPFDFRLWR